ncbi:unnamed protein product [Malus baccata var. baccata]
MCILYPKVYGVKCMGAKSGLGMGLAATEFIGMKCIITKSGFDGAWKEQEDRGGTGVVLRNDTGQFVAALARKQDGISSPLLAEIEAARAAILLVRELNKELVELEGDAALVLAALNLR